jgi:hypothetical protein
MHVFVARYVRLRCQCCRAVPAKPTGREDMTQNTDHPHLSPDGKWFWDGTTWQQNIQAPPPPPPMPPMPPRPPGFGPPVGTGGAGFGEWAAPAKVDNSFAWAIAFAPLLIVLINGLLAVMGGGSGATLAFLAAVGLNVALALADSRRVRAAGQNLSTALAVLLVPVYLFLRQGRLRQNYAIPIVWCVSFLISLGGAGIIGNTIGVQIDTGSVERSIQTGVQKQLGQSVTVQCPSSVSVRTGASFQCVVKASDGSSAIANVTVQNSQGEVVWRLQ